MDELKLEFAGQGYLGPIVTTDLSPLKIQEVDSTSGGAPQIKTFEEEYIDFLKEFNATYDKQYIFQDLV